MQYSVDIATEQNFRNIEFTDTKIWISKMHHCVGFWQIGSQLGHNRENFGALLKSIIGNLKSIIDPGLSLLNVITELLTIV